MDNMMQGYDVDAAVSQIGKAVSRAAHVSPQEAQAFVRRAIEADLRYMHETGVLDDDGLMGEESMTTTMRLKPCLPADGRRGG